MMARIFAVLVAVCALTVAAPAFAKERIENFDVLIDVQRNGDFIVTETIDLVAEGDQIRRGILRDLPRYYESDGDRLAYDYDVQSVERDGRRERYETESEDNAYRIRIGNEDVIIPTGPHRYAIRYRVRNQVRYFDRYDEVYWNATGAFWTFPIIAARATVRLPSGGSVMQHAGYTGPLGATGGDFTYTQNGDDSVFATTRPLEAMEGLTVAVGFAKGLIDPPSEADRTWLWWQRNGSLAILLGSLGGLFFFLYRAWTRVGRDPARGPVFPRYEPPANYSPAATHYVYNRGASGNSALIATLMNLAVKGRITIDASDKKQTTLTQVSNPPASELSAEDLELERRLFRDGASKTLGGTPDTDFTDAYAKFQSKLANTYGTTYFRWNVGYTIFALVVTVLIIIFAAESAARWTGWHTLSVLALAALNGAFLYFMPSATPLGQQIRSEIQGFRLYMETAEKLQLNAVQPGSDAPPPMTTERYEKFLPYAVALGVEAPWTKHFERLLPQEAAQYTPVWSSGAWGSQSFAGASHALVSNINSGVSSAMPQSSSSSGSGGGGSSGGGGGGGGGSGW